MDWNELKIDLYMQPWMQNIEQSIRVLKSNRIIERIWLKDYTVWSNSPDEITNRLDWLTAPWDMQTRLPELNDFYNEIMSSEFSDVVLLGMGGSSLAPELFAKTLNLQKHPGALLHILDTTDPDAILALQTKINLEKTLFLVATKSGGTIETLSLFKHFYNLLTQRAGRMRAGSHFVAITDPASKLVSIAETYKFRKVFLNNPNIGGRYSVFSLFGMLPAILKGIDVVALLDNGIEMAQLCKSTNLSSNPGALLGAILGALNNAGKDKLTIHTEPELQYFGDWLEQLLAESTGKNGKGILPVIGEPQLELDNYSSDRVFVFMHHNQPQDAQLYNALNNNNHPALTISIANPENIGQLFYVWEFATAIAGYFMDINPFDQPNVELAKALARQMLEIYQKSGQLPSIEPQKLTAESLRHFLGDIETGRYISIQAFVNPSEENLKVLRKFREKMSKQYSVPVTLGIGPRYLHSTGQLHKGDSGKGKFIQIVTTPRNDIPIPDETGNPSHQISFGTLKLAQAYGDFHALRDRGREIIQYQLKEGYLDQIMLLVSQ